MWLTVQIPKERFLKQDFTPCVSCFSLKNPPPPNTYKVRPFLDTKISQVLTPGDTAIGISQILKSYI